MHSLITHFTIAALALHISLGCCAHHAHGCEPAVQQAEAECEACPHHVGRDHGEEPGDSHNKAPHSPCDEQDCSFVVGAKIVAPQSDMVVPLAMANAAASTEHAAAGVAADRTARHHASCCALPLRAHLLFQVFLI